jgi:2-dehydropantoate 2-reductase
LPRRFARLRFIAEAKTDIMRWKYRKLLSNLGNAVDALCGRSARNRGIYERARAEGMACFAAAGISFVTTVSRRRIASRRWCRRG